MTGGNTVKFSFLVNAAHQNMNHFIASDHNERMLLHLLQEIMDVWWLKST